MKQNVYRCALIGMVPFFYSFVCATSHSLTPDRRVLWSQPIAMGRVGVTSYFSHVFNEKGYGSYCIEHVVDFLGHVSLVNQPLVYISRIIDIFHVRLKEAE